MEKENINEQQEEKKNVAKWGKQHLHVSIERTQPKVRHTQGSCVNTP